MLAVIERAVRHQARCAEPAVPLWRRGDLWLLWLAFAAATCLTFASTVDDPFITLRYAHNLLHGYGPVFNPGQRVNGATSPAGLLSAVLVLLLPGGYVMLKLKLVSLTFAALTVGWSKRLLDGFDLPPACRWAGLFLIGASPVLGFNSASGLETTIAAFAVVGLLVELRSGRAFARPARASLFAALAVASRPEAALLVAALAASVFFAEHLFNWWTRVRWVVAPALAELAILGLNRWYYGSWLPNTYHAKALPLGKAVGGGFGYLYHAWELGFSGSTQASQFFTTAASAIADGFLLGGLLFGVLRFRKFGYLVVACAAQGAFILESGGDWMQGSRFLMPVAPVLIVLVAGGIATVSSGVRLTDRARNALLVAFAGVTVFPYVHAVQAGDGPVWEMRSFGDHGLVVTGGYQFSGLWADMPGLMSCVRDGQTVATTEAGLAGFARPNVRLLDLRGLTSSAVAEQADPASRHEYGIQDTNWGSLSSPVGRILLQAEPVAIITLDSYAQSALGGRYQLVAVDEHADTTLLMYAHVGSSCDGPLRVMRNGSTTIQN